MCCNFTAFYLSSLKKENYKRAFLSSIFAGKTLNRNSNEIRRLIIGCANEKRKKFRKKAFCAMALDFCMSKVKCEVYKLLVSVLNGYEKFDFCQISSHSRSLAHM